MPKLHTVLLASRRRCADQPCPPPPPPPLPLLPHSLPRSRIRHLRLLEHLSDDVKADVLTAGHYMVVDPHRTVVVRGSLNPSMYERTALCCVCVVFFFVSCFPHLWFTPDSCTWFDELDLWLVLLCSCGGDVHLITAWLCCVGS